MNNLEKFLYLFIISMVPLIELRGAMIYAAANNMPFLASFACCVIGNIKPCQVYHKKKDHGRFYDKGSCEFYFHTSPALSAI